MERYKAGSAVRFDAVVRNHAGTLVNGTSVTIQIYFNGEAVFSAPQAMTVESTGCYYYIFQTATGDDEGYYTAVVKATVGGYHSYKEDENAFYLKT